MRRETWTDLATFAAIADAGSFTRAAEQLGVSTSALSHALRALETRLGVKLLERTTRRIAPTRAGEQLLEQLRPAIASLDAALDRIEAGRATPAGRLRIAANRTAAIHVIQPRLAAFAATCPDVQVELSIVDGPVDIVAGGFDAGVRYDVLDAKMVAVRIGEPQRMVVAAAPDYLARAGEPASPQDLLAHRCLVYRIAASGALQRWRFDRDGQALTLDPPPALVSNDAELILAAARSGLGVAVFSEPQVAADLAAGSLVDLLADWCPVIPAHYLYYPARRQVGPALHAFVEMLREAPAFANSDPGSFGNDAEFLT
ncbi:LysR family transcriptional regulator [Sphingomonas sp. RT2P30]|uniref:LysR family transcriptional regulator n=1 Tax=Parasphingomonas halimpatiens TaxID=3096162 RepID=UPI002FCBDA30